MFEYYNANPLNNDISDCFIRATSLAEGLSWRQCQEKLVDLQENKGKC